jgi:PAS domain S-box-containing protein
MTEHIRVLLVEDNQADVDLIREMLPETGAISFRIESVSRLSEAQIRLKDGGIDLALIDLGLPDSQGISTFKLLRKAAPDIPMIVLTGNADQELAVTAVKEGAQDYLVKGEIGTGLLVRSARYAKERKRAEDAIQQGIAKLEVSRRTLLSVVEDQKRTEDQLRESEERFRNVFDNSAVGKSITALDGSVHVNPAFCQMLGYTMEELAHQKWQNISHPDDIELSQKYLNQLLSGEKKSARFIKRYFKKDGSVVWADVNTVLQKDKDGKPTYYITGVMDITERKKADKRIRKLNRVYAMLSNINQAIVRIREPQALFQEACRVAVEEGGFTMAWIGLADPVTGNVNPVASAGVTGGYLEKVHIVLGDEAQGSGPIGRILKAGEHFVWNNMENDPRMAPWHEDALRMGFRSCVAFPLKVSGQVRGALKLYATETGFFDDEEIKLLDELAMDVSFAMEYTEKEAERRQAEQALRQSEQRFRILFEQAADIILLMEITPEGMPVIRDMNSAALRLLGYERDELIGRPVSFIEAAPDASKVVNERRQNVLSGTGTVFGTRHRCKDGTILDVECSVSEIQLGSKTFAVSVERDITERKRMEKELNVTLAKYKTLFDCFPLGINVTDEAGNILETNPTAQKLLSVPQDEQNKRDIDSPEWRIVRPDGTPMPSDEYASMRALKQKCIVENMEMGIVKSDKTITWINVTAAPLPLEGHGVVITYNDITERKRAEEKLRESEERYRTLFDDAKDGIALADAETGRIVECNHALCEMVGMKKTELIGHLQSIIHPPQTAEGELSEAFVQHKTVDAGISIEDQIVSKTGTLTPVEIRAARVRMNGRDYLLGIFRDITERRRAEESLRESEERYRRITQAVTDYIYTVRIANGRPIETIHGEACAAVTGYTSADFFADPFLWLNMVHREDQPAVLEQTRQILAGLDPKPVEHRIFRKDSKERWVLSTLVPHFDDRRNLLSYEGIIQDVTERKQAELDLKKAHDELEKKVEERTADLKYSNTQLYLEIREHKQTEEKLHETKALADAANKAKSDFLAGMSHELRTPLNSVIGFSQLLREQYFGPLNGKQLEYVNDIEEGGNHLLSLINDILDLSKIEAGKETIDLSTFNLSLLLQNSFVMIKEKCHIHGIALSADIPVGLEETEITADERKIKQVVFNLLSNASKFTPDGGAIKLGLRKNGGEFIVVVTDDGIGVPPEYQQKVFEDFYQIRSGLTSKTKGTGLGLALCKRLVEMHGGRIWVVSEGAEKGSVFSFSIPVKQG